MTPAIPRTQLTLLTLMMFAISIPALAQRPLGIDVSSYQGSADKPVTNIYWPAVKSAGITFTWAKATEGTGYIDADLTYNMANAKSNGVLIGMYHFAHPDTHIGTAGADTEAAYFINTAAPYLKAGGAYMMPMLDYETAPGGSYTKATSSQWINEWCQDLVNYGQTNGLKIMPVVYTYTSFATTWIDTSATNWPLWMASYPSSPNPQTGAPASTSPWTTWAFWQYSSSLFVNGVENMVDTDTFNGSATTLTNYVIATLTNAPAFASQPSSMTAVLNSNATFSASVSGYPIPTLQWRFNGANISGANGTSYTISSVQTNNAGNYSIVASNVAGSITSTNAVLTVVVPLTFTTQPTNLTVVKGSTATFNVAAIGTPAPGYQWQFNAVNIPGATSNVLTIPNVQTNKQGNYTVAATNSSSGSIISSNAFLTVVTLPSITTQPTNVTVNQGGSATFAVAATGTPSLIYQWQYGGSNISGANASTYTIANVQPGQGGNYRAVVTNNWGSITSSNAVLTVNAITPPQFTSVTVSNGVVQLVITGPVGGAYAIDVSSNLNTWTQLTTFTNTTGTYQFIDPSSTNNATGFYRARSLP